MKVFSKNRWLYLAIILMSILSTHPSVSTIADDGLDVTMWPESVGIAKKKFDEERLKKDAEVKRIAERVKWITHEDPNRLSDAKPEMEPFSLPKAIVINGKRYSERQVIGNMLHAVFSNSLWFGDSSHKSVGLISRKKKQFLSIPRHHVVNKWAKSVRVTFKTLENNNQVDSVKYGYLIDHLNTIIPAYSKASGLDMSYVQENYPKRSAANVFIVLNARSNIQNAFKNHRGGALLDENDYEVNYIAAVRFTPYSRSQVEGFFIPNAENEIEKATCYLKPEFVPENVTKALLNECLARILGFPELTESYKVGVLSNWNREFDGLVASDDMFTSNKKKIGSDEWLKVLNQKFKEESNPPVFPNEYDLKLVSLLYCPSIKSGMGKYEVVINLLSDRQCLDETNVMKVE